MSTELCQDSSPHTVTSVQCKGKDKTLSFVLRDLSFPGSPANASCLAFVFFQWNRIAEAPRKQLAHVPTTDQ